MEMNKKQDSLPMGSQEEMSAQIVLDETDDIELVDERRQKTYIEQIIYGFKNMPLERKVKAVIIAFLAIGIAVFHLYTSVFGTLPSWQHRSFHTGVMVSLCFILKPVGKNKFSKLVCDWIPFVLAITTCLYMFIQYPGSELRAGKPNTADIIFGTILTLLVIYAARRACGKAISYICLVALAYVWAGPYMPGLLAHPGFSYSRLIDTLFLSTSGIFGSPIYVSSTVIVLFILFGAFLGRSGGSDTFIDLAKAIAGNKTGGPALIAVVSSSLIGTVTGTGTANVTITGSYTIPLMKKVGYKPEFAAGVEATASQGGQIMPPIMGAAAFMIADTLGVAYIDVVAAALIPALFYYLTCTISVILVAKRDNLPSIPKDELPRVVDVIKRGWFHLIPLFIIIFLLVSGKSAMRAGFFATAAAFLLSFVRKETRIKPIDFLATLENGARSSVGVAMACAAGGIITGIISLTGLGTRFSRLAIQMADGRMLVLLLLVMVASIIMGMGLPTVSCYVLLAVLTAPALIKMGVTPMAAHLFVFYFGIISGLTPPVATTSFTAAGIADCSPMKAGIESVKLAMGGFIVPFLFVYNPTLLLEGTAIDIITGVASTLIGCFCFTFAANGYMRVKLSVVERIMLLVATIGTFIVGITTDIIGIVLLIIVWMIQTGRVRKQAAPC